MKKLFLLTLSLALGFSAIAQHRVAKSDIRSGVARDQKVTVGKDMAEPTAAQFAPQAPVVVSSRYQGDLDYAGTVMTFYDLQSNQFVANRMYQLPNGSVAVTATMSHLTPNNATPADRGTGYNFYKPMESKEFATGEWIYGTVENGEGPDARVESWVSGWPTIAQWGDNGEILLSHGNGALNCYTREFAGEGEWQFRGALPNYPEGYPYNEYPTWPRVVTTGDHHNIIHVAAALQHSISSDETDIRTVLFRSEDAENWTVSYGPLEEYNYHIGTFSADDYALAANGHTVALLYSGQLTNSVWMFKSTDDGLTWNTFKVWENPYEGRSFDYENGEPWGMEDTLFIPMNGAITVDNNGTAHVALNTHEIIHTTDNQEGYYTLYYGRSVDGLLYWNDTQEAPMQDTEHPEYTDPHLRNPNPHHVARLWWPDPENPGYVTIVGDTTKWIGWMPYYEEFGDWSNWTNYYYHGDDYYPKFYGTSGQPALSCDPQGNLACAYSAPCSDPENSGYYNMNGNQYFFRHVYVSYRNVDEGYWHQIIDDISDGQDAFEFSEQENTFTMSVPNTVNDGEFWFGFQTDPDVGWWWGSNAAQTQASENVIYAVRVLADPEMVNVPENHDAVNPVTTTRIYPNPVVDQMTIEVNAAQASEMSISVYNLMGQKVMDKNVSINTGINTPTLNTSSLSSGVYFVTVKANGFENTMKFVVK